MRKIVWEVADEAVQEVVRLKDRARQIAYKEGRERATQENRTIKAWKPHPACTGAFGLKPGGLRHEVRVRQELSRWCRARGSQCNLRCSLRDLRRSYM